MPAKQKPLAKRDSVQPPTGPRPTAEAEASLKTILKTLDDNKAEDIITLPLTGKSPLCDFMVIATGRSARHVAALAEMLDAELAKAKPAPKTRVEGKQNGDWVLVDTGDIIIHLFRPEVRSFYNLEKLWSGDQLSALA